MGGQRDVGDDAATRRSNEARLRPCRALSDLRPQHSPLNFSIKAINEQPPLRKKTHGVLKMITESIVPTPFRNLKRFLFQ